LFVASHLSAIFRSIAGTKGIPTDFDKSRISDEHVPVAMTSPSSSTSMMSRWLVMESPFAIYGPPDNSQSDLGLFHPLAAGEVVQLAPLDIAVREFR
jgi:hypothetical protein